MSAQENAELVRLFFDCFNRRDFDQSSRHVADEAEWVNVATGETFRGPAGVRQYEQGWATAFPDGMLEITNLMAGDTGAAVEFIGRGTHTGPLTTPAGEIPPTGRAIEVRFCEVYDIRGGKAMGCRLYFDLDTFMRQLGLVMPKPTEAAP